QRATMLCARNLFRLSPPLPAAPMIARFSFLFGDWDRRIAGAAKTPAPMVAERERNRLRVSEDMWWGFREMEGPFVRSLGELRASTLRDAYPAADIFLAAN